MLAFCLVFAALVAALAWGVQRKTRCRHEYGRPTSGYIRCLRCTRRFPIEFTPLGEWRIGKVPLD